MQGLSAEEYIPVCLLSTQIIGNLLTHNSTNEVAEYKQSGVRLAILRFCRLSNSHDKILLRTIPLIAELRLQSLLGKNSCI